MSFDSSEVLPWEPVAAIGGNGEPEPAAAGTLVRTPDGEVGAPWYVGGPAAVVTPCAATERLQVVAAAQGRAVARPADAPVPIAVPSRAVPVVAAERHAVPLAGLPNGVELRRLAAAALLTVTALGAGRYRVEGGREPHHVDLRADGAALPVCDCGDACFRGTYRCKHELAARAAAGEAPIAGALAVLAALVNRGAVLAALPTSAAPVGARRAA